MDDAVVVAVGGNLPTTPEGLKAGLEAAVRRLPAAGLRIVRRSRWWRSASWPDPSAPDYLNAVVLVETDLGPEAVLCALHAAEAAAGRVRAAVNASRGLDLDLIAYGRLVTGDGGGAGLVLPHPRAALRLFVMGPLAEIAPDWRHPILGLSAAVLAARAEVGRDARLEAD